MHSQDPLQLNQYYSKWWRTCFACWNEFNCITHQNRQQYTIYLSSFQFLHQSNVICKVFIIIIVIWPLTFLCFEIFLLFPLRFLLLRLWPCNCLWLQINDRHSEDATSLLWPVAFETQVSSNPKTRPFSKNQKPSHFPAPKPAFVASLNLGFRGCNLIS